LTTTRCIPVRRESRSEAPETGRGLAVPPLAAANPVATGSSAQTASKLAASSRPRPGPQIQMLLMAGWLRCSRARLQGCPCSICASLMTRRQRAIVALGQQRPNTASRRSRRSSQSWLARGPRASDPGARDERNRVASKCELSATHNPRFLGLHCQPRALTSTS
jgi:hypothetical protein